MLSFPTRLTLILLLPIFYSCSHTASKKEIAVFKVLNQGITNSTLTIFRQTEFVYHTLENKLDDPVTHNRAVIWYPKAIRIQKLSADVFDYIQTLRIDLLKETGFSAEHPSFNEVDKNAGNKMFCEVERGKQLFQELESYKDSILAIDPLIKEEFGESTLFPQVLNTKSQSGDSINAFFKDLPAVTTLTILNQLQNNVRIFENKTAAFCNQQVSVSSDRLTVFSPMISQNSTYLKKGETLEVKAGVISFVAGAMPKVVINHTNVEISDYGYAEFKLKVSNQPGRYFIPIKMEYVNQDGIRKTFESKVDYTIAE